MTVANWYAGVHLLLPGLNKETSHLIVLVWRQTTPFVLQPCWEVLLTLPCFCSLVDLKFHGISCLCGGCFSLYSVLMLLNTRCVTLVFLHQLFFSLWFSRFLVDPKVETLEVPCHEVLLFSTVGVFSKGAQADTGCVALVVDLLISCSPSLVWLSLPPGYAWIKYYLWYWVVS